MYLPVIHDASQRHLLVAPHARHEGVGAVPLVLRHVLPRRRERAVGMTAAHLGVRARPLVLDHALPPRREGAVGVTAGHLCGRSGDVVVAKVLKHFPQFAVQGSLERSQFPRFRRFRGSPPLRSSRLGFLRHGGDDGLCSCGLHVSRRVTKRGFSSGKIAT